MDQSEDDGEYGRTVGASIAGGADGVVEDKSEGHLSRN